MQALDTPTLRDTRRLSPVSELGRCPGTRSHASELTFSVTALENSRLYCSFSGIQQLAPPRHGLPLAPAHPFAGAGEPSLDIWGEEGRGEIPPVCLQILQGGFYFFLLRGEGGQMLHQLLRQKNGAF